MPKRRKMMPMTTKLLPQTHHPTMLIVNEDYVERKKRKVRKTCFSIIFVLPFL
jgi:hypothetical protein